MNRPEINGKEVEKGFFLRGIGEGSPINGMDAPTRRPSLSFDAQPNPGFLRFIMVESLPILNRQRQKAIEKYFVMIYYFLARNINWEATNAKG